jgi:hypothetical protein
VARGAKTAVELEAIGSFLLRSTRRAAVTLLGTGLLGVGLVGLALPVLPGWLFIFGGLAVLAREYAWARDALDAARRTASSTGKSLRSVAARRRPVVGEEVSLAGSTPRRPPG